ncbi:MAG: hypothetical protein IJ048_11610, partial [Clostridia bacterium]|nr:hypothetical protein [Clostridia bacterium]
EYYVKPLGELEVDSLDEDIGREFVQSTHERYARFFKDLFGEEDAKGRRLAGSGRVHVMFTDEPGAGRYAWPRGFAEKFMARYGYDIRLFLPDLMDMEREADGQAAQARIDYQALTGEMFRDNYFKPIHDWARRNHLLSGGHIDIDHQSDGCLYHHYGTVLQQLRELDLPGVDVIWHQITRPTSDGLIADLSRQTTQSDPSAAANKACAEGNGFFPRFASSAAAQSGGKFALSESFAVYGGGLEGDEMRYVVNFQLARGINVFNFMSMSYARNCAAALLMRPNFVPEMPGYDHLRGVNDYTARACYLMQLGRPGADTALYYPARDIWAGGETGRRAVRAFDELGRLLEARQVDFDIIDDEGIRLAAEQDDALSLGLARYSHVIVPDCRYMPEDVKARLRRVDGNICPAIDVNCPSLRVRRRLLPEGATLWMLFNESGEEASVSLSLPGKSVCRLNADSGVAERVEKPRAITLRPGEARFYLCGDTVPAGAEDAPRGRELLAEATGFTIAKAREMVVDENGLHSRHWPREETACALGNWEAYLGADFSGEAVYRAQVELPEALKPGEICEIDLGRVECSAQVSVNGRPVGIAWCHPMRVRFDGALLEGQKRFELAVEVANSAANQCAAQPLEDLFPAVELGPYQEKLRAFERFAPQGGLYGPVTVSKLTT